MCHYIPIHIDNIDNILASETIYPSDCYSVLKFGYGHFKTLNGVPSNHVICLYYQIPIVNDSSVPADSICYVAINDECIAGKDDILLFDGGIAQVAPVSVYPWNCSILFPSEDALNLAVAVCRTSLCNKMWEYYRFELFSVRPTACPTPHFQELPISIINVADEESNNRLKGFLYSFVLGRYSSIPPSLANLLQIERRMYDVATTISGLRMHEKDSFLSQLNELEEQFEEFDPNRTEIRRQWQALVESRFESEESQLAFKKLLNDLDVETVVIDQFARKASLGVRCRPEMKFARNSEWEYYKKSLEEYTLHQIITYRGRNGGTDISEDLKVEGYTITMNSKYGVLYSKLITNIINGLDWLNIEDLRLRRLDVASELTRMIRDILLESGKVWDNSEERAFLNELRQHIASGACFDVSQAPNIVLKSLAMFVLKGDDFEELLRYMENNAMSDYRFVFGLMGACIGYVDLPKTIIQRMMIDSSGVARIYLSAVSQIVKIPDGVALERHQYNVQSTPQKNTIPQELEKIFCDKTVGLTRNQQAAILDVWHRRNGVVNDAFFAELAKIRRLGTVKVGRIKKALSEQNGQVLDGQLDLFEKDQVNKPKVFDISAWQYIEPLLPNDESIRDLVRNDFKWFIESRRKTETNRSRINNYKYHLRHRGNLKSPISSISTQDFKDLNIDSIINQLEIIFS